MDLIEKAKDIDFALLALHGKYGEDGTVQGTLESLGIPYSGSNMLSSGIYGQKSFKKILRYEGVETPDWIELTKMEDLNLEELEKLGFPLVVKPNSGGSSVGVKIVYNKNELISMLETVFEWDSEVVIEKYIKGEEITCSILMENSYLSSQFDMQLNSLITMQNMMMLVQLKR